MISVKTTLACFAAFSAGALLVPRADMDLTKPPKPAEVHAKLSMTKADFATAIQLAAKETGALPRSAEISSSGDIEIELFSNADRYEVVINGQSGEVKSNQKVGFSFPGQEATGEMITTPSGLMYYELVEGSGEAPLASSTVKVHYTGWMLNGKKFDSSHDRGQPAEFPLNRVIKGWTEGVGGMKPGGKRKLVIPGNLAYGPRGMPAAGIPGDAMLVFDVELIEIVRR